MITWEGRSAAGLRIPAELPDLDIESSIARSMTVPEGGALLLPKAPEYIPTLPLGGFISYQSWDEPLYPWDGPTVTRGKW